VSFFNTKGINLLLNYQTMKGISYITDDKNKRKALVIDLKTFKKNEEEIEDLLDVLIAESKKRRREYSF
jgi:hypothetical protein